MFSLPESTVFGRKIPKQVFYEKADVTAAVKRLFVDYVDNIIWQNKLSPNTSTSRGTIPVSKGKNVIEIEVIELQLKSDLKDLSDLLSVMDKATPHHAVFIVTLLEESQIWIGYKEIMVTNSVKEFKVTEPVYFHTDWQKRKTLGLFLEGMSIDDVYENLIRYVEPKMFKRRPDEALKQCINRFKEYQSVDKERSQLRKKMNNEIQTNRKLKIKEQIKKLNAKIKELQG